MKRNPLTAAANGVYRATADVAALRNAADRMGCSWFELDLSRVTDKPSLLRMMARQLRFPDGFGENWDALADCLQDLSWLPAQGRVVVLKDSDAFAAAAPAAHEMLMKILAAAAADWRRRERVFVVLAGFPPNLPVFPGT